MRGKDARGDVTHTGTGDGSGSAKSPTSSEGRGGRATWALGAPGWGRFVSPARWAC